MAETPKSVGRFNDGPQDNWGSNACRLRYLLSNCGNGDLEVVNMLVHGINGVEVLANVRGHR